MPTIYIPEAIMRDVNHLKQLYSQGQAYYIILSRKEDKENEEEMFPHTPSREEEKEKEERNKNKKKAFAREKEFDVPTFEEVKEYVQSLKTYFSAETFFDYYEAIGWEFNRRKIHDWKAVARFWADNEARNPMKKAKKIVAQQQQIAEERERVQREFEMRYQEAVQKHVSYEEYQRMKRKGNI